MTAPPAQVRDFSVLLPPGWARVPLDARLPLWIELLARTGLPVQEARFRNSRTAQRAHRGAAPHWPMTAGFGWLLPTVSASLLAVGLPGCLADRRQGTARGRGSSQQRTTAEPVPWRARAA